MVVVIDLEVEIVSVIIIKDVFKEVFKITEIVQND